MWGPVRQPSAHQRGQANITAADSSGAYDKWLGLDRWQGGVGEHRTSAPQAIAGYEDAVKPRGSSHVYPKTSGAHRVSRLPLGWLKLGQMQNRSDSITGWRGSCLLAPL